MTTKEGFKQLIKEFVTDNPDSDEPFNKRTKVYVECWNDFLDFLDEADSDSQEWDDYVNSKYTKALDKEVEAVWQRRNSKLARILK